jgi:hypothetical protein
VKQLLLASLSITLLGLILADPPDQQACPERPAAACWTSSPRSSASARARFGATHGRYGQFAGIARTAIHGQPDERIACAPTSRTWKPGCASRHLRTRAQEKAKRSRPVSPSRASSPRRATTCASRCMPSASMWKASSLSCRAAGRPDILDKIERSINGTVELFNAILDVTKLDAGVVQPELASRCASASFLAPLAEDFAADGRPQKPLAAGALRPMSGSRAIALSCSSASCATCCPTRCAHPRGGVLLSARPCKGAACGCRYGTAEAASRRPTSRVFSTSSIRWGSSTGQSRHLGMGLGLVDRASSGPPARLPTGTAFQAGAGGRCSRLTSRLLASGPATSTARRVDCGGDLTWPRVVVDDDSCHQGRAGCAVVRQWGMQT